jgi:phage shock protein B
MMTTVFGMLTIIAIIFMVAVLPVWLLLHYLTKMKAMRGLKKEDQAALEQLWDDAAQMKKRIKSLETILDIKYPEWRNEQ